MARQRGKVIRIDVDVRIEALLRLLRNEFDIRLNMLHDTGRTGRKILQRRYLSRRGATTLKVRGFGKSPSGRYKVKNRVGRRADRVIFTSFVLNPHEFGRTYKGTGVDRSPFARKQHKTDTPRYILTRQFRGTLQQRVSRIADIALRSTLRKFAIEVEA